MRLALRLVTLIVCCIAVSGCATMRYPGAYKVEGKEFKEFRELDDEKALKVIALIYNVQHETWEDGIARSLALEEYLNLMRKRKSLYIKKSGVFNIQYEKVKLASWKEGDLIKLYDTLAPKAEEYYMDSAPELTEIQNASRIVRLTAISSIAKEMKRRDIMNKAMSVASQVLLTALMIAISMI